MSRGCNATDLGGPAKAQLQQFRLCAAALLLTGGVFWPCRRVPPAGLELYEQSRLQSRGNIPVAREESSEEGSLKPPMMDIPTKTV